MRPSTLLMTLLLVLPWSAQAQFARLSDAVKYRQAGFQVLGTHVQRAGAMAKGEVPFDKPAAEANAALIELLSRQLAGAFPPGSDMAPSKVKPEVWLDAAKFKTHNDQWQSGAAKLSAAARSGDANAFKTAFNTLAQSCKACHDGYRNR
ncbi:MAG: cytochrome c [Aquabacterium sp.]|uniref:c-type cytochrome n=1 Tax=Aquabacterium sp. TaxID=1872578 RepID=UPI00271C72F2|nr:cytochrome c [Aquabacterium sp.]MDO9005382.1 cytochrome c [Aquabacterium sp.]